MQKDEGIATLRYRVVHIKKKKKKRKERRYRVMGRWKGKNKGKMLEEV